MAARLAKYGDIGFVPAYVSAFLSSQYILAKDPKIAGRVLGPLLSAFHCKTSSAGPIWRTPNWAMIVICVVLAGSISSILRNVKADKIYASLMLFGLATAVGTGWALDLNAEQAVFGLLPHVLVTTLLLVRAGQSMAGHELEKDDGQLWPTEKA